MLATIEHPAKRAVSEDRVVSVHEAALIGGVSASTLKRRALNGELRIIRMSPRRIGIRMSELQRWLDSRGLLEHIVAGIPAAVRK